MKVLIRTSLFSLIVFLFTTCSDEPQKGLLPNITGSSGEVIVVINKTFWQGDIGKILAEILTQPVNGLPQHEPMFNVIQVTPGGFAKIFHSHRNIIFVRADSQYDKPEITVERDKWAASQLILNIQAPSREGLQQVLEEKGQMLTDKVNVTERERWMRYYRRFMDSPAYQKLTEKHHLMLTVPSSFVLDVNEKDFAWLSYETPTTTQAVLLHYFPYIDRGVFSREEMIERRNELTREKVKGPAGNSYMKVEDVYPADFRQFKYKGRSYAELRGLWTLENGFMGGPFVTLFTVDQARNRVVMLDAFVYAPDDEKRELMRQTESVLYTIKFPAEEVASR